MKPRVAEQWVLRSSFLPTEKYAAATWASTESFRMFSGIGFCTIIGRLPSLQEVYATAALRCGVLIFFRWRSPSRSHGAWGKVQETCPVFAHRTLPSDRY